MPVFAIYRKDDGVLVSSTRSVAGLMDAAFYETRGLAVAERACSRRICACGWMTWRRRRK